MVNKQAVDIKPVLEAIVSYLATIKIDHSIEKIAVFSDVNLFLKQLCSTAFVEESHKNVLLEVLMRAIERESKMLSGARPAKLSVIPTLDGAQMNAEEKGIRADMEELIGIAPLLVNREILSEAARGWLESTLYFYRNCPKMGKGEFPPIGRNKAQLASLLIEHAQGFDKSVKMEVTKLTKLLSSPPRKSLPMKICEEINKILPKLHPLAKAA